MESIYHICSQSDWEAARRTGVYTHASLAEEGFIHCSQSQQIPEVARRYFPGIPDLVLLEIDPEKLTSEVRWEKVDVQSYPHVYGPINLEAIARVRELHALDR